MTLSHTDPRVLAILLAALHDRLDGPRAPRWQRENESGFADGQWRNCPKCKGDGQVRWKSRTVQCDRCHGRRGWRTDAYDEKSGPVAVDSRGASELTLSEFWTAAERLARDEGAPGIERLERYIERRLERGLTAVLEDEARSRGRQEHPSTLQLWDGLSVMLRDWPHHAGLLYRVHVWGWWPVERLTPGDAADLAQGLVILGSLCLPAGFRAPPWALKQAAAEAQAAKEAAAAQPPCLTPVQRQHRDEEIRRLSFNGRSQKQIAARVNCDQATVSRVLNGKRKKREAA